MDAITSAVVIAGLTTVGKPTAEAVISIVSRMLSPSLDAVGEGVAAPLRAWAKSRGERASATLLDAAQILHEAKIDPQPVPGRLLWPILEKSSVEDDLELHRRWVALLTNASIDPDSVQPAFGHILGELSQLDATILDWMLRQSPYRTDPPSGSFETVTSERMMNEFHLNEDTLVVVLANLDRNNLIVAPATYSDPKQLLEHRFQHTHISTYGVAFMRACSPPQIVS